MCNRPKLVYSKRYNVNVDLEDGHCTSARAQDFGRIIPFSSCGRYIRSSPKVYGYYMHRIVCDACVPNPRPDLFDVVDHIDGKSKNNNPKNLRWVNQHLNNNNLHTLPGRTPPGVRVQRICTKSGKWYSRISFNKNNCLLKSFRTLQKAVDFANYFNPYYFRRLYDVYLMSPRDPYERRMYWAKHAICVSDFRCDMRKCRALVLAGKFLFSDTAFKKLTLKKHNGEAHRSTGGKHAPRA